MKKVRNRLVSLLICICLCAGMIMPAVAAEETNTLGITFNAELDVAELQESALEQTVVLSVNASSAVTLDGIGFSVSVPEGFSVKSVTSDDLTFAAGDYTAASGIFSWASGDSENVDGVTNIAKITYTVPANAPAGTYELGITDLEITKDYGGDIWESAASAKATLTISNGSGEANAYAAQITTLTEEVSVDDTVTINVGVDDTYAAAEVILTYDSALLEYNEAASTLGAAAVKAANGSLKLEDYGESKNGGNGVYVIAFTAKANGTAAVTLTSAAFVDMENAAKRDLIPATIVEDTVEITISKKQFAVTLDGIFTGPEYATDGESYTFAAADGSNYDYDEVTATVDGVPVDVTDNGDGTYTVENVTGELVITGSRTEKIYSVTVSGNAAEDITDAADKAVYNTDYSFTVPTAEGWAYSLESITIAGNAYTGYSVETGVYTIPGGDIKGDIVITVTKSQTIASVTVEGSGAGAAAGYAASADIGQAYTLTIVPAAGYTYTVTAVMNGQAAELTDNQDNTYTIANVTGNIVFTVERTVVVDGVAVSQYVSLDGTLMWLIKNDTTVDEGYVPTYDGNNMLWSEEYNAYCYLVIADTLTTEEAAAKVGIASGTAVNVDYGMDVNMTGKVDASDAQLTYNMYNNLYDAFTADVTVEKFLRADVNKDGKIDVEDAAAIIAAILA